jgi:hypothetical protein
MPRPAIVIASGSSGFLDAGKLNSEMKALRALATKLTALQDQARALGMLENDRELLVCVKCGLLEDDGGESR